MRYFRRTEKTNTSKLYKPGEILPETLYKPGEILPETLWWPNKDFQGNEYWEEVIVTPKPQPKKYKKEVALFQIGSSMVALEAGDYISTNYSSNRITDWALVEFVEKT